MSLQVCHCCGWTKVTTYHGLRVHQGRMGCTPRGARIAEPQQLYMWNLGQTNVNLNYKLEVRNTVKIESSNYYSDVSLQTCHCGWKKMTNYHGLRTHQGMMGCMPKGVRIPKEEQSALRDRWEPQLESKTLPVAKKVNTKEENSPEIPRMRNSSNPTSAAKVKKENKSASSQKATRSKSRHQLEERFTPLKTSEEYWSAVSTPVRGCNNHVTTASRIKAEPVSPPEVCIPRYPDDRSTTLAERDESSLYLQMNHWLGEIPAIQQEDRYGSFSEHPRAPTEVPHGTKDSLLPTSGQEMPRSQLLKEIQNCLEKFKKRRVEKMMNSGHETVDESSRISTNSVIKAESLEKNQSCLATQQHPLQKPTDTKTATAEQRNESVSKCSTQPLVPAKRKILLLLTGTPEKGSSASAKGELKKNNKKEEPVQNVRQTTKVGSSLEAKKSPPPDSLQNPTDTKVASSEQVNRAAPPVVPPKRNLRSFRVRQLSGRDITNDLGRANSEIKVKELVRLFSVSAAQENTVGMEEKPGSEHPRVKLLAQRHSAMPAQGSGIQPKVEDRQEKRATDIKPDITPTAAEEPQTEAPSSLCEPAKPDVPTSMKNASQVKELAQMFSTQEAAAGPREKRGQGHGSSQVKLMAQRFLQPTSTDAIGQLKKEDHDRVQRAQQKLPDSTCNPSKMKTAAQKPTMHQEHKPYEASQVAGLSTRSKVKDLARMFSTKTM